MPHEMDASLLQDFLTEAGELVEQLDADLVRLESANADEAAELLNAIFRALHTVKGAAGFLGLTIVTSFAHAAEDALNRLRKGDIAITPSIMDTLLACSDVLRAMVEALNSGEDLRECPPELIEQLQAIVPPGNTPESATPTPVSEPSGGEGPDTPPEAETRASDISDQQSDIRHPLQLPAQKQALLEFMVADLRDTTERIGQCLETARDPATCQEAMNQLQAIAEELQRTVAFFELDQFSTLIDAFAHACDASNQGDDLLLRLAAVNELIMLQADALAQQQVLQWPLDTLIERLTQLGDGEPLEEGIAGVATDVQSVLVIDGVKSNVPPEVSPESPGPSPLEDSRLRTGVMDPDPSPDHQIAKSPNHPGSDRRTGEDRRSSDGDRRVPGSTSGASGASGAGGDQTIRVEVSRLEALLNLVGQLVLTKNRFLGLNRRLHDEHISTELHEELAGAANELDRLTGNLQVSVMRTRMQPMAKLFDRYPRVIRDLARATGKQINLEMVGKDTEVDKSVLELLADPLVHILRNSADHGIESPEQRTTAGKQAIGTIRLSAEHQGSHVRVEIRDDGKGIDRTIIGRKAVEKGLTTEQELAAMSDEEVLSFIFAPGFSTAEQVTDLSGRGVGMDVVRANIAKLNGSVNVASVVGQGATIEVLIPLTVAIMPAMVVGVGAHLYAVPLSSVMEIVRPDDKALFSVTGQPVLRLREQVLPLIDLRTRLNENLAPQRARFAVVVAVGSQQAGLLVDRLIGQEDIVVKPLEDDSTQGGPFSGSTIREDGGVSLILDIVQLVRQNANNNANSPVRQAA